MKVIIGLGVALALTQLSAGAQIDVTTDSGDTVQLGPGGVSIQTRYGKKVDVKAPKIDSNKRVEGGRSVKGAASNKTAEQISATSRSRQKNSSTDPAQLPAKVQALMMLSGGAVGTSRKPLPKVIDVSVDDIILYDNNINQTLTCTSNGVVVQGSHCSLSIVGNCRVLSISGNFNTVRCENVGAISVPGSHNTIYWARGLNGRKLPTVSISGNANSCSSVKQP